MVPRVVKMPEGIRIKLKLTFHWTHMASRAQLLLQLSQAIRQFAVTAYKWELYISSENSSHIQDIITNVFLSSSSVFFLIQHYFISVCIDVRFV